MLLFISGCRCKLLEGILVSIHLMLLFISGGLKWVFLVMGFNTSHVTLYQGRSRKRGKEIPFQYISCYSLSRPCGVVVSKYGVSIHLMLLFIKSAQTTSFLADRVSIHLMLLFIPAGGKNYRFLLYVSIHLMLLFIFHPVAPVQSVRRFQYISCYSLSFGILFLQH